MPPFVSPKLYGIIGDPLSHSLSPLLHNTAFRSLGIPGVLLPWPMPSGSLPGFIGAMRLLDIQGACVTIPHKQAIMPLLDETSELARRVGAVNLLYRRDGMICGDNTDVHGFMAALEARRPPPAARILLLGSGGAARAAAAGMTAMGFRDITVSGATEERAVRLAREFGLASAPWDKRREVDPEMIVNATPLGMEGRREHESGYPGEWLAGRGGLVYDLVYTPLGTRLLREAGAAGWETLTGLDMFVNQADRQFRVWTGQGLPGEARRAVAEALGRPEDRGGAPPAA